jgi:hypothetical protein
LKYNTGKYKFRLHRIITIWILISACLSGYAQDTYFKNISLFGEEFSTAFVIKADSMDFYLSSSTLCIGSEQDSFSCLGISKLDQYADIIWDRTFNWSLSANKASIKLRNDSVFVSGHISPGVGQQVYNFLILNTKGDSLFGKVFDLVNKEYKGVYNNGLVISNDKVYIFGQTSTVNGNYGICTILKYNLTKDTDTLYTYFPEFGEYFPGWDMAVDTDGHLLIFSEIYRIPPGLSSTREILKIDSDGHILRRYYGPDTGRDSQVGNQFLLLKNGTYFYLHHIDLQFNGTDDPQLINMDTSGQIVWTIDFPKHTLSEYTGRVTIREVTEARNGDILLAGSRKRRAALGSGDDIFLMRVSPDGEILWERHYNTAVDLANNEYHHHFARDVQELADGSILLLCLTYHHDQIVLLRVDENGCIADFGCDLDVLLSSEDITIPEPDGHPYFYPNPTYNISRLAFEEEQSGRYTLYDLDGKVMAASEFNHTKEIQIDVSSYQRGMYQVVVKTEKGIFTRKIIKE